MGSMPIWPIGPAWKENGWRPTPQELKDFELVAFKYNAPLVSYWDWQQCRRDCPELWPADVVLTTPTPTTPPADNRLAKIEQKVADLEKAVTALAQVLSDLKAILK